MPLLQDMSTQYHSGPLGITKPVELQETSGESPEALWAGEHFMELIVQGKKKIVKTEENRIRNDLHV